MVSLFSLFVTGCELPAIDYRLVAQDSQSEAVSADDEPAAPLDMSITRQTSETTSLAKDESQDSVMALRSLDTRQIDETAPT